MEKGNSALAVAVAAALLLAGCVSAPTGPSVLVLPGSGKSFEQFRADDFECRQFASYQVNGATPDQSGVSSGVKSAAVGAAVGAAAGALMGGHRGAGTGAGVGLIAGSLGGTGAAQGTARNTQRQYDYAYQQCMYAKGHKVPVSGYRLQRQDYHEQQVAPPPPPPPPPPQR
jgi:Glycine-zipper domain